MQPACLILSTQSRKWDFCELRRSGRPPPHALLFLSAEVTTRAPLRSADWPAGVWLPPFLPHLFGAPVLFVQINISRSIQVDGFYPPGQEMY